MIRHPENWEIVGWNIRRKFDLVRKLDIHLDFVMRRYFERKLNCLFFGVILVLLGDIFAFGVIEGKNSENFVIQKKATCAKFC